MKSMLEIGSTVKDRQGITYVIDRISDIPTRPGRQMLHVHRPNGKVKYVIVKCENGGFLPPVANPFQG
jgi:hypothetical protein